MITDTRPNRVLTFPIDMTRYAKQHRASIKFAAVCDDTTACPVILLSDYVAEKRRREKSAA